KLWYANVRTEQAIEYFSKTYEFLSNLVLYDGVLSLDYTDLKQNYASTLLSIFDLVFPRSTANDVLNSIVIIRSEEITKRDNRTRTKNDFFGEKESSSDEKASELFEKLKKDFSDKFAQCITYYENSIRERSNPHSNLPIDQYGDFHPR